MFGIIVDVSDLGVSYAPDAGLVVTVRWKQEIREIQQEGERQDIDERQTLILGLVSR